MTHISGVQQQAQILKGLGSLADGSVNLPYSTLSLAQRFFHPGERTRDLGSLGDLSGQVEVPLADLFFGFESTSGKMLGEFDADIEISDNVSNRSYTAAKVTLSRSSSKKLILKGLRGGSFTLHIRPTSIEEPAHSALFSVPHPFAIHVDRASLIEDLPSSWTDAEANAELDRILEIAHRVAAHALRAMNIRLYFPGENLPAHYEQAIRGLPAALSMPEDSEHLHMYMYPEETVPGFQPSHIFVAGQSFGWFASSAAPENVTNGLDLLDTPMFRGLHSLIEQQLLEAGKKSSASFDPWGCNNQFLSFGLVNVQARLGKHNVQARLGGHVTDGEPIWKARDPIKSVEAVEEVLAEARTWRPIMALSERFAELAGRSLGIQISHAVCQLLNLDQIIVGHTGEHNLTTVEEEEPLSNAHPDLQETIPRRPKDKEKEVVHTQLVDPFPDDPLQDFLGIARPEGRPIEKLHSDLAEQQTAMRELTSKEEIDRRKVWIETADKWVDLCHLHGWYRQMWVADQSSTSPYDVLAGFYSNDCLDEATCIAPLPIPYAGLEFREGDRDANGTEPAVYAGNSPPDKVDTDLIALVQQDLRRIGLHWGIGETGLYGYLRFTPGSKAQWDGAAGVKPASVKEKIKQSALIAGHTALTIREFQIIADYPFLSFERLNNEPVYANRLYPIEGVDLAAKSLFELKDSDSVNPFIDGRMSSRTAYLLQRFRFGRRRSPIVMESWKKPKASQRGAVRWTEDPIKLVKENLISPHDVMEQSRVTFVVDRSKVFADSSRRRRRLGTFADGKQSWIWRGPLGAKEPYSILLSTWENTFPGIKKPTDKDELKSMEYLMRIISGVLQQEAGGYLDGYQAYDNAVFSLPPFHPTIARGDGDDVGQMGGYLNFFQRPPIQILKHVFPMPPEPIGPMDNTQREEVSEEKRRVAQRRETARRQLRHIWYRAYGRFGVGVGWSDDRMIETGKGDFFKGEIENISLGADSFISLPPFNEGKLSDAKDNPIISMNLPFKDESWKYYKKQRALYQSYSQWFRTWPWVYRFVGAVRADVGVRLATTIYMLEFARRTFQQATKDKISSHFDGSDWTASYLLRAHVRGWDRYKLARGAVSGEIFSGESGEADRRQAIEAADSKTQFPSKRNTPHEDFGDHFYDSAHPSGKALEEAFLELNSLLLASFASESKKLFLSAEEAIEIWAPYSSAEE